MLEPETLQRRRSMCRLFFLFKVVDGLVPAINPEEYLKPQKQKRRIKPKTYENFKSVCVLGDDAVVYRGCAGCSYFTWGLMTEKYIAEEIWAYAVCEHWPIQHFILNDRLLETLLVRGSLRWWPHFEGTTDRRALFPFLSNLLLWSFDLCIVHLFTCASVLTQNISLIIEVKKLLLTLFLEAVYIDLISTSAGVWHIHLELIFAKNRNWSACFSPWQFIC